MPNGDDFFQRMCKDAAEQLANGKHGWREMDTNTLLMACFHLLTNHLTHKLSRPLWLFASAITTAVITYVVSTMTQHILPLG